MALLLAHAACCGCGGGVSGLELDGPGGGDADHDDFTLGRSLTSSSG